MQPVLFRVGDPFEGWQPPTVQDLQRIAREEGEGALEELGGHLRAAAAVTPGWEPYADRLGVHAAEGETYLGLEPGDPDEQAVFDLEYGTETQAPTGLLRNTLSRHGDALGSHYSSAVTRRLMGGDPHAVD